MSVNDDRGPIRRTNRDYGSIPYDILQPDTSDSEPKPEPTEEEAPSVSYFTLFRYATILDKFCIILAIIFSIVCGCTSPFATITFANLLQSMVEYAASANVAPDNEAFLTALRNFAIYQSIIGLILVALTYAATVLMNVAAFNQVYRIRQEYLKAALNQDFEYFDKHKTGDFASKMTNDVLKLEDGIGEKLGNFIYYQACFVSNLVMAFIKGWKFALYCSISFPVSMFLVGMSGFISMKLAKTEAVASGKAGAIAEEVLSSMRVVYAFSGQRTELERYEKHLEEVRTVNIKKGFFTGLAMGSIYFSIFGSYSISFWFGYQLMINEPDKYDVSTMIAVFYCIMSATTYFGISGTLMEVFGVACGAGAQIFNLLDNVPKINPLLNEGVQPEEIKGNIELKNVVFHYPTRPDVPVLKDVSLNVVRGQSVALVGHSGCGKSTIIQLISRYYDIIDGSVCVDGCDVRDLSVQWLRAQIGLVGQEPVLFNTTVRENIRYGREDASDENIENAAKQAYAHKFIMKLPMGYDTLVGERGTSLSGGQKQRIAIARVLVRNPSILLLDEATSALDTASEAKVQKALDKAQEGRTTIVVAHRLSTIRNVDFIYVFKSGSVVESGNHEELMEKKGLYYDMVMMQSFQDPHDTGDAKQLTRQVSAVSEKDEDDNVGQIAEIADDKEEVPEVSFWEVIGLNSPEWKSISIASVCSVLSGLGMPLIGVVLGDFMSILTDITAPEVREQVINSVLIFLGLGIFSAIVGFITVFFYEIAGEYLTERLRRLMFKKLLQQEIAYFDDKDNSTGALCARLAGETALVQGATGQRIGTVVQAVGTMIFAVVLSLMYEWRVALVSMTFAPFMGAILYKEGRMAYEESFGTAKTMEASSKVAVEAVANVRTVASLGKEDYFLKAYALQLLPALKLAKRSVHWRGIVFGLSRGLSSLINAVAFVYGGTLIIYQKVNFYLIIQSAQALLMGSETAAQAFAYAPNFQKGIQAAGRIIVLLSKQSKITDPKEPDMENFEGTGAACLQGVEFAYPTRRTIRVLKSFDLDIKRGITIALVGASGCGKSTVIQLLERYYDPNDGVVAQDGIPINKVRLADARRTIGFVQQEPILFDRTLRENIAYGDNSRTIDMSEIIEAAKQANIHDFITSLPSGYETNIGTKGTQLSGGQKQRIAIARALIRRPKMLLLDEATSALDSESEQVVQEALDRAKEGRTCVMIAHRLSTVRDADVICVVHDGRIAEIGTHAELIALKGLFYNLNKQGYS